MKDTIFKTSAQGASKGEQSRLEAARWLHAQGYSVIPILSGDKKPTVEWKQYQTERADDATLAQWFSNNFVDLGIVTGAISDLVVVDIEGKAIDRAPDLPATLTATTPSGGRHYFYRHPGTEIRNAGLKDAQGHLGDIRGDGGYVVAPPSQGRDWLDVLAEIAPYPTDQVPSALSKEGAAPSKGKNRLEVVAEIDGRTDYGDNPVRWGMAVNSFKYRPEGDRHNMLCILSKAAHNAGVEYGDSVRELVNASMANGYYADAGEPKVLTDIEDGWSWGTDDPENPLGFKSLSEVADFEVKWLWRGMWKAGKLGGHVGFPETFKTTSIVSIGAMLTRGVPLPGEEQSDVVARGGAVNVGYLTAEDEAGEIRMMALNHEADPARFFVVDEPFAFDDVSVKRLEAFIEKRGLGLVVVDSQSSWPISNQQLNSPEYGKSLTALQSMAKRTGCTILVVRHMPKHTPPGEANGLGSITIKGIFRFETASQPIGETGRCVCYSAKAGPGWGNKSKLAFGFEPDVSPNDFTKLKWTGAADRPKPMLTGKKATGAKVKAATNWLFSTLASGPQMATDMWRSAKAQGHSVATVRRVTEGPGRVVTKFKEGGVSWWRLRTPADEGAEPEWEEQME